MKTLLVNIKIFIVLILVSFLITSCNEEEVKIGDQIWTTQNLSVRTFRNGDTIYLARNPNDWIEGERKNISMCCFPHYDSTKVEKFGMIYNWYAVKDSRGLAPNGYHIASLQDWEKLILFCGGKEHAGKSLKSIEDWYISRENESGQDLVGFHGLPCNLSSGKDFDLNGKYAHWWTSTSDSTDKTNVSAIFIEMRYDSHRCNIASNFKDWGMAIRCLKNR